MIGVPRASCIGGTGVGYDGDGLIETGIVALFAGEGKLLFLMLLVAVIVLVLVEMVVGVVLLLLAWLLTSVSGFDNGWVGEGSFTVDCSEGSDLTSLCAGTVRASKFGCDDEATGWFVRAGAAVGEAGCVLLSGWEDDFLDMAAD